MTRLVQGSQASRRTEMHFEREGAGERSPVKVVSSDDAAMALSVDLALDIGTRGQARIVRSTGADGKTDVIDTWCDCDLLSWVPCDAAHKMAAEDVTSVTVPELEFTVLGCTYVVRDAVFRRGALYTEDYMRRRPRTRRVCTCTSARLVFIRIPLRAAKPTSRPTSVPTSGAHAVQLCGQHA